MIERTADIKWLARVDRATVHCLREPIFTHFLCIILKKG